MICNRKEKQASNEREAISNRIGLILISVCSSGTNSNTNTHSNTHSNTNTNTHSNTDANTHAFSSSYINNNKHAPR
jgi:hypothetical protein